MAEKLWYRIDHLLNSLIENIKSIKINKKPRSREKPSDHPNRTRNYLTLPYISWYLTISVSFKIEPSWASMIFTGFL